MIIKKVRLGPFGGISDQKIELENGLNVIVGPNEAGKSTVFNGIQKALFTPSKLNKRNFDKEIRNHIPVGGGDTAKVELDLLYDEELHTLKKSWGGSKISELLLPDGTLISNEENVQDKLKALMAAEPGTYRSVLMTYQSGLAKTLDDLKTDPDTLSSLGDVIRKAVFETEGISVEKFNKRIDQFYNEYFEHWDHIQEYPENNRGIENPYKRGIGKVLNAFYIKEDLKSQLQNAVAYENELDRLNTDLSALESEISVKSNYLKENKKAVEDARNRHVKGAELELCENKINSYSEDHEQWVMSENKIRELNSQIPLAEAKLVELKEEKSKAEIKAKNEDLLQKFSRAEKLKEEKDSAEETLKSLKKLEDAELKSIRDAFNEVTRLKAVVEAGELRANLEAKSDFKINIQKNLDDEFFKELVSGESLSIEAGGKIKLEHPGWKLEIISGEEDIDKVAQSYESVKKNKDELLSKYDVSSLEKAEELNKQYNTALNAFENATRNLENELEDDSYEELQQKIEETGAVSGSEESVREFTTIVEELADLGKEFDGLKEQLASHTKKVEELRTEYNSKKELILELAKISARKDKLEKEINDLSSLPEGFENDAEFISEYESIDDKLQKCKENKFSIMQERLELQENAPTDSAEEIADSLKDAEASFTSVLRKAEAIARIKEVSQELLEDMDSDTYGDLKKDLEEYVTFMTDGRHNSVKMDEGTSIPCGFARDDGAVLDYELLSAGTKDVLSLALRLSMAKYFLQEASGFLIMDDPFVDMDPERQQRTGELIRRFAEDKQVIIFTCHPKHSEFLGGNQIEL